MKSVRATWVATSLLAALALTSTGCFTNAIAFSTSTQTAVEIATTEGEPGVRFGYRRIEGVSMPTKLEDGRNVEKAYSVLSFFSQDTGEFFSTEPNRLLAPTSGRILRRKLLVQGRQVLARSGRQRLHMDRFPIGFRSLLLVA